MAARVVCFVVIAAILTRYAFADPADDLLTGLGNGRSLVRAAVADKPLSIETVEVDAIKGVSRERLLSSWGTPDNCIQLSGAECAAQKSWVYYFFYLPAGWRGGGPELWLTFNTTGIVEDARWQFSR
jgi:hypothetical protein